MITYRELRLLEIEVLKTIYDLNKPGAVFQELDVLGLSKLSMNAFFGIEIQEWPARIAEVAMWLIDHQMNIRLAEAFGQYFVRLPLKESAKIHVGNALRLDWKDVLLPDQCSYILGNPPFIGKKARDNGQVDDMALIFGGLKNSGNLDYVTCWYQKAADYIQGSGVSVAFVSTNSISQGEQPSILWPHLFENYNIKIHFAYRTFQWESEARGKAHVHVVIVGFGAFNVVHKRLYEMQDKHLVASEVRNISPYLIEDADRVLANRPRPISAVPEMQFGNMPNDDGNFLLTDEEKERLVDESPEAESFIRPFISAKEFIHGENRWCIWLKDVPPHAFKDIPEIMRRIASVKSYREKSQRVATAKLASVPTLFGEIRQPQTNFILIPRHSGETRSYVPMSFFGPTNIVGDSCLFVPDATPYHFGVLTSAIHMAWMRQVCGRLESRYRYSAGLVYNNFPWPESPTDKQRGMVETLAQAVLDVRAKYPLSTLADLYDPLTMPPDLVKAHAALDRAVDQCYRPQPFTTDRQRVEFLFALYERLAAPLLPSATKRNRRT